MNRVMMRICVMVLSVAAAVSGAERKPVTNSDVVAMIKAGLPETTIIMAIQQGPAGYDTSAAALIDLKSQGATPGMLEAMMQPAASVKPVKTTTGNALLDAYAQQMAGAGATGVVLRDGDKKIQMKYATMSSQAKTSFAPFAPTKAYSTLAGNRSSCRVSSHTPRFEFSLSRDVQPKTRVALILFAVRGNSRIIQSVSASFVGVSSGFPKERVIELEITEVKGDADATSALEIQYVATPTKALAPGEYALAFDGYTAYDFGVDAMTNTSRAGGN